MSKFELIGGVGIMGVLSPMDTIDTYAVIDPIYGIDGLRNVSTINEMLSIPVERRRAGMIVGVIESDKFFKLKNVGWIGNLSDWEEIDLKKDTHIDKEVPSGVTDGINISFNLSYEPILNSEHLFLNGVLQEKGGDLDYVLNGKSIIFLEPPFNGMRVICSYRTN